MGSDMILYNGIYQWKGLGKPLGLAQGKIMLKIFRLDDDPADSVLHMRPNIVVVSDVPGDAITVKGWAGPLATSISGKFGIDPQRMLWIEHYPEVKYGVKKVKQIPEIYEVVDFTWREGVAISPRWRPLRPPMLDIVKSLVENG